MVSTSKRPFSGNSNQRPKGCSLLNFVFAFLAVSFLWIFQRHLEIVGGGRQATWHMQHTTRHNKHHMTLEKEQKIMFDAMNEVTSSVRKSPVNDTQVQVEFSIETMKDNLILSTEVEEMKLKPNQMNSLLRLKRLLKQESRLEYQLSHAADLQRLQQGKFSKVLESLERVAHSQEDSILENILNSGPMKDYIETLSREVGEGVQRFLHRLQFGVGDESERGIDVSKGQCKNVRTLSCDLNKACGFGCQIHHLVHCFSAAIGTRRVLLVDTSRWQYGYGSNLWDSEFQSISACKYSQDLLGEKWNQALVQDEILHLHMPIVEMAKSKYLPPNVPPDVWKTVEIFHGRPEIWWVGQLEKFILRETESTLKRVNQERFTMEWSLINEPLVVGLHVRRTDKLISEAQYHDISEYMKHAENYFESQVSAGRIDKNAPRHIYLASDDPKSLVQAQTTYPKYKFFSMPEASRLAEGSMRYSADALRGTFDDIYHLSQTDFIVCTFSSQVCRLAYELMQTRIIDGSQNAISLDDPWYYGGQLRRQMCVTRPYTATTGEEMTLNYGDELWYDRDLDYGWVRVQNKSTGTIGIVPQWHVEVCPANDAFVDLNWRV